MRNSFRTALVAASVALGGCGTIVDTLDPPKPPKPGDLKSAAEFRGRVQALIESGAIAPGATSAALDQSRLASWTRRSVAITPDMYPTLGKAARRRSPYGLPPGMPADDLGFTCADDLKRPYVYLHYNIRGRYLEQEGNDIALSSGSCTTLDRDKIKARIGFYSFAGPFSTFIPPSERIPRARETAGWFDSQIRGTDFEVSELGGMLVAERAGYVYETISLLLHSSYERIRGNFYHLVLIGDRTMISLLVKGPKDASVSALQATAWPIVEAIVTSRGSAAARPADQ
jgi:hypothetical protein